jgi:hypothetical protein
MQSIKIVLNTNQSEHIVQEQIQIIAGLKFKTSLTLVT